MRSVFSAVAILCMMMTFGVQEKGTVDEITMNIEEVSIHDPSIIKDFDGSYYVFGSHISTAKSRDLINWKNISNGYARENNTHFGNLSENLAGSMKWSGEDDSDCKGGFAIWAPDVYYNKDYVWDSGEKGAYMMYYSASSTYKRSCIGLAVSRAIDGVYEYRDTVIYSGFTKNHGFDENSDNDKIYTNTNIQKLIEQGIIEGYKDDWGIDDYNNIKYPNAIDPCVYESAEGDLYLTYGSWSGGIFALEIDKETGLLIYPGKNSTTDDGRMVDCYFGTHIAGGKGWSGEGPFIYYDDETKYYYLQTTYEWLGTDGGYHIRLFRSESPLGPFVDICGRGAVYGENHASHGVKMFGNYYFESLNAPYTSGGHSSVLKDGNERYAFYHTRFKGTEYFQLRVHQMFMNEDGWPVVAPFRYLGDKLDEADCSFEDVVGFYEYIDHGNAIGEGNRVAVTKTMELKKNGEIGGIENGRWEQNGKYLTVYYGDEVLKGVFFRCKDEKGACVMTFSVTGGENRSLWGVKKVLEEQNILKSTESYDFTNAKVVIKRDGILSEVGAELKESFEAELDGTFGLVAEDISLSDNMTLGFWIKSDDMKTYTPIIAATKDFASWFSLTNFDNGREAVIWARSSGNDYWLEGKGKGVYADNKWQYMMLSFNNSYYGDGKNMVNCTLYVNGYACAVGYVPFETVDGESKIYIGINPWDEPLKATIRSLEIFDKSVTHAEAYGYYNSLKGENGNV